MIPPVPPIPTEGEKTVTRARRKTQAAADLFNKLSGRSEEMEGRSRSDEEGTGEKEGRRKLRKSISDGEGLRGRGRVADMVARAEGMPKPVGTGVGNGMGALGPAARVGGGGGGVGGMI